MANNKIIDLSALQEFLAKCDIRYQATLVSGTNIKTINNTTLLGSGNYAFDSEFSEVSTNALQNQVISKEIREINYELAVIRESLFATTLTEIDYEEQWATLYTIPETLTDDDGTHRLVYSETQLKMAKGNSVVANQLAQPLTSGYWGTNAGSTTFDNNVATYTPTAQYGSLTQDVNLVSGHTYLLKGKVKLPRANYSSSLGVGTSDLYYSEGLNINLGSTISDTNWHEVSKMATYTKVGSQSQKIIFVNGEASDFGAMQITDIVLIDLTQEFPINTPTSVDDVRVKWLIAQGYIPTNTGTLASTTISGVKVRGFNQWDEEWELGEYSSSTGLPTTDSSHLRSKSTSPIRVIPNVEYYFKGNFLGGIFWYDKNDNFIKVDYTQDNHKTAPTNAYYMRFVLSSTYGTTYNHDICINVSNANLNGTYKPFVEYTISVPQTTLRSAGSVQDYIEVVEGDIVEGEQLYNVVKHTLVGSVDLSILIWTYTNGLFYTSGIAGSIVNLTVGNETGHLICSKYSESSYNNIGNSDKSISTYYKGLYLKDSSLQSTDTPTGTLNYERATPTTENIATNLHFDQVSALIEQGGTIEPIYTDVPCDLTTTFVVKKAVGE